MDERIWCNTFKRLVIFFLHLFCSRNQLKPCTHQQGFTLPEHVDCNLRLCKDTLAVCVFWGFFVLISAPLQVQALTTASGTQSVWSPRRTLPCWRLMGRRRLLCAPPHLLPSPQEEPITWEVRVTPTHPRRFTSRLCCSRCGLLVSKILPSV